MGRSKSCRSLHEPFFALYMEVVVTKSNNRCDFATVLHHLPNENTIVYNLLPREKVVKLLLYFLGLEKTVKRLSMTGTLIGFISLQVNISE